MNLDLAIQNCIASHSDKELALGFLRYEALRKLNPRQFADLHQRNLKGENFDAMVTDLVINQDK